MQPLIHIIEWFGKQEDKKNFDLLIEKLCNCILKDSLNQRLFTNYSSEKPFSTILFRWGNCSVLKKSARAVILKGCSQTTSPPLSPRNLLDMQILALLQTYWIRCFGGGAQESFLTSTPNDSVHGKVWFLFN